MLSFVARLIGGAFMPLIDKAFSTGARLLRKLALFVLAGVCLLVVVIALTVAFALWVASLKGAIVATLSVAGLYLTVAGIAVFVAMRPTPGTAPLDEAASAASAAKDTLNAEVDAFAEPLLQMLSRFGLRREQLAVLAGMSVAKQIGPMPLVGLAITAGFLIGRLGRGLFPTGLIETLMDSDLVAALFRGQTAGTDDPGEQRDAA